MTKKELFKKYNINESHSKWSSNDNWISVDIYREMHNGSLPKDDDMSIKYVVEFLDTVIKDWVRLISLQTKYNVYSVGFILTAKRMIYRFADQILTELNAASI